METPNSRNFQWARDLLAATTWDALMERLTWHRMEPWRRGLEMRRAQAERKGVDLVHFEAETLEKVHDWIARVAIDPHQQFFNEDPPPPGVRQSKVLNPNGRVSAAAIPEPAEVRESVTAVSSDDPEHSSRAE